MLGSLEAREKNFGEKQSDRLENCGPGAFVVGSDGVRPWRRNYMSRNAEQESVRLERIWCREFPSNRHILQTIEEKMSDPDLSVRRKDFAKQQ